MANRNSQFLLKRSNTSGKVPLPGDLLLGELALNTADVILYTSGTTANQILPIGWDRLSITGGTVNGNVTINGITTSSGLTLTNITNATGDFITIDNSNVIRRRTPSQVLTDIGAQSALTNPITGTGTTNFISKFTGGTTLGNSQIFDNGTNVGIGTTSPSERLDINGNTVIRGNEQLLALESTGSPYIRFNMGGNGTTGTYLMKTWGSSRVFSLETMGDSQIVIDENDNQTDKAFIVRHNGTTGPQLFRVQENGNVGIGTTTPTYRLSIIGDGIDLNGASVLPVIRLRASGLTSSVFEMGRVGLGTFFNNIAAGDLEFRTTNTLRWKITSTGIFESNGAQTIQTSTGNLTLATNGGNGNILLTPNGTGRVGIGTTSPLATLDLRGTYYQRVGTNAVSVWQLLSEGGTIKARFDLDSGDSTLFLRDSSNTYTIKLDSAGTSYILNNVGIGVTSTSEKLTVADTTQNLQMRIGTLSAGLNPSIRFTGKNVANTINRYADIQLDADNGVFNIMAPATTSPTVNAISVLTGGNVGIGTTSPAFKLQVTNPSGVLTDSSPMSAYGIGVFQTGLASGQGAGIAFTVYESGDAIGTRSPGGAIVFERTGTNSVGDLIFKTRSSIGNADPTTERWRITSGGTLQSNGAQRIQTSTGNLTLSTEGGNGNILLTPNGTGSVGIGTTSPTADVHMELGTAARTGLFIDKASVINQTALDVLFRTAVATRTIANFRNTNGSVLEILGDGQMTHSQGLLRLLGPDIQIGSYTGNDASFVMRVSDTTSGVTSRRYNFSTSTGNLQITSTFSSGSAGNIVFRYSTNDRLTIDTSTANTSNSYVTAHGRLRIGTVPNNGSATNAMMWDSSTGNVEARVLGTGAFATIDDYVPTSRTIQMSGTTNQVTVSPTTAENLTQNRTFTFSLPQNIHTGATPTFAGLTVNGSISIRATVGGAAATQVAVFTADPSSTTRQLVTRTPVQLLTDTSLFGHSVEPFGQYIGVGGGSDTVLASGEARTQYESNVLAGVRDTETLWLLSDQGINFEVGIQSGWSSRISAMNIASSGVVTLNNLRISANTLSSVNTNGNIILTPNGTGYVRSNSSVEIFSQDTQSWGGINGQLLVKDSRDASVGIGGKIIFGNNNFGTGAIYALAEGAGQASSIALWNRASTGLVVERLRISSTGALRLNSYGSGTFTGTATQKLAVDTNGNVIEIPIGSGPVDGNGTTNFVTKWSDSDTITNSIIFDNGTNVGIGTTSPSHKLHVVGNSAISNNSSLLLLDSAGNNGFQIRNTSSNVALIYQANNGQLRYRAGFSSNSNNAHIFAVGNDTEIVRFNNDGNVGIGNTSPSERLHVTGRARITTIDNAVGNFVTTSAIGVLTQRTAAEVLTDIGAAPATGSTNYIQNQNTNDQSANFRITGVARANGGMLLSGASNARGDLTIGTNESNTQTRSIHLGYSLLDFYGWRFTNTNNPSVTRSGDLFIQRGGSSSWINAVTLNNIGDMGIGTTSPSERLHVEGRARITTIDNGTGDFITTSATGVLTRRTPTQVRGDIGAGTGNGTVTSITAGDGLSGGTITTSGTITVDDTVVRTTGNQTIGGTKTFSGVISLSSTGVIDAINLNNNNIINVNNITISDPGPNEGIQWLGGNGWRIYESPDNLSNTGGNLQFVTTSTRRMTLQTDGRLQLGEQANTTSHAVRADRTITVGNSTAKNLTSDVSFTLTEIGAQAALTNPVTGTGTAGQVSFWNGTTTQIGNNNLFWDNTNGRLGIGITTPLDKLHIQSGYIRIVDNAYGEYFLSKRRTDNSQIVGFKSELGGDLSIFTTDIERWRITSGGTLQSNGAQRIQTSTGNLTLSTEGGNGNILLTPNGTGFIQAGGDDAIRVQIGTGSRGNVTISSPFINGDFGGENRPISFGNNLFINSSGAWQKNNNFIGGSAIVMGATGVTGAFGGFTFVGMSDNDISTPVVSTLMKITGAGNVGIGTTSPSERLHVTGNIRVTGGYYDSNNEIGTNGQVLTSTGTGTDWKSLSEITGVDGTGTANFIAKWSDADTITNSIIFDNGTNVGIGTISPGEKLEVGGNLRVGSSDTENYISFRGTTGDSPGSFNHTYVGERIYNPTEGSELLIFKGNDIDGQASGADRVRLLAGQLRFDTYTTALSGTFAAVGAASTSTRMIITNAGNVGIGTTAPEGRLHISDASTSSAFPAITGTSQTGLIARFQKTDSNGILDVGMNGGSGAWLQVTNRTTLAANYNLLLNPNGGNVGIGTTSPSQKLHIEDGNILLVNSGNQPHLYFTNTSQFIRWTGSNLQYSAAGHQFLNRVEVLSGNYLSVRNTDNTTVYGFDNVGTTNNSILRFRNITANRVDAVIDNSGNVGIGTTNPSERLQVNGNINIGSGSGTKIGFSVGDAFTAFSSSVANYGLSFSGTIAPVILSGYYGVGIYTNQTERVRVLQTGNVGIGITPLFKVHVRGTGQTVADITDAGNRGDFLSITADGTAAGSGGALIFGNSQSDTANSLGMAGIKGFLTNGAGNTVGDLVFLTRSSTVATSLSERWRIISTGILQAASAQTIRTSTGNLTLATAGGNGHIILSPHGTGNVGIGTTTPSSNLQIQGSGATSATSALNVTNSTPTSLLFVRDDGFIGMGTTTPSQKLNIVTNTQDNNILLGGTSSFNQGIFFNTLDYGIEKIANSASTRIKSANRIIFNTGASGGSERMRIDIDGNVGIGISIPSSNLEVARGGEGTYMKVGGDDAANARALTFTSSTNVSNGAVHTLNALSVNGVIALATNSIERLRISSTGALRFNSYGSGTFTGTATQRLAVDTNGNVIEIPIGSGPVDGNGTANFVTKWSDSDTITNSIIFDNGTNVGIGTTSPSEKLHIAGGKQWIEGGMVDWNTTTPGTTRGSLHIGQVAAASNAGGAITFGARDTSSGSNAQAGIYTTTDGTYGTRMYFATSNNYATGAVTRMTILQAGNVGIGNTSPTARLQVQGQGTTSSTITLNTTDSAGSSLFIVRDDGNVGIGTSGPASKLEVSSGIYNGLTLSRTATNAGTYIAARGWDTANVLRTSALIEFAQTSASGASNGRINFFTYISNTANLRWSVLNDGVWESNGAQTIRTSTGNLTLATNGGNGNIILSPNGSGNVGIGITSPVSVLHVLENTTATNDTAGITIQQSGTGDAILQYLLTGVQRWVTGIDNSDGDKFKITTGIDLDTNARLTIDTAGNVGIGTTSPLFKLHVLGTGGGDGTFNGGILVENNNATAGEAATSYRVSSTPASNYWFTGLNQANAYDIGYGTSFINAGTALRVTTDLRVGIGTVSPTTKLQVVDTTDIPLEITRSSNQNSGIKFSNTGSNFSRLYGGSDSFALRYFYNATEYLTIATNGNVGIGTTSPSQKLDVQGNITITKALLSNQENLDVDSGAIRVIATISSTLYDAAFFDFVIKKGTNRRAGTVYVTHNGTSVEFTETSTNDLGTTSDVTLSVDLSGGNIRLLATTLSNDWIIKTLIRGL